MTATNIDGADAGDVSAVSSKNGYVNYPNHFIENDLTKRQRRLLVGSVFVTAVMVTYFTGIRPGNRISFEFISSGLGTIY